MSSLLARSPQVFTEALLAMGRRRAWIACSRDDAGASPPRASLTALEPLARALAEEPDYDRHEAIFLEVGPQSGALYGAFLHDTLRGQGQGGLRCWRYASTGDFLRDGLRLAQGMGRKSALAGLWWGGGKGVIADPGAGFLRDPTRRRRIFAEYGRFVTSLHGCYVTAEDVGTQPDDMRVLFENTRFATCIPEDLGGSGNPAPMTAAGVVCAIEAALAWLEAGDLDGKAIAMQGAGNVSAHMIPALLERGVSRLVASETSAERRAALLDHTGDARLEIRLVEPGDASILAVPCDVLVPNALGGVLGPKTIPELRTQLVCGAANNVLEDDDRDGRALAARGISLVPDFIANRLGIVACCDEHAGRVHPDPRIEAQLGRDDPHGIHQVVQRVLGRARDTGETPVAAANALADEAIGEPHPIRGDRSRRIIASLLEGGWADEAPKPVSG
jgi:glutamate dehydrogenase/leucine dehydrogenase